MFNVLAVLSNHYS